MKWRGTAVVASLVIGLLVACDSEDRPASTAPIDTAIPAAATAPSGPPVAAAASASPSAVVPLLRDLYRPQPYAPPEMGVGARPFPTRVPPPTLDAANDEAERFLDDRYPLTDGPPEFAGLTGVAARQCFDVSEPFGVRFDGPRYRSGDIVLDTLNYRNPNFDFALLTSVPAGGVLIRATYLDAEDSSDPPTMVHELAALAPPDVWHATLVLPEEGRWLVVVTAGPQWGCFVVAAPRPEPYLTPARTVAEAERAGAERSPVRSVYYVSPTFSKERGPNVREPGGWTVGGGSERVCLDTRGIHDARSGEWVMRPTAALFEQPPTAASNKLLLVPLLQTATLDVFQSRPSWIPRGVRLTATHLDAPHHTYVYESPDAAAYTTGTADGPGFEFQHIVEAVLPRKGPWLVVVTDGALGTQWGCFTSPGYGTSYPWGAG